jgi:hypothetical protein
MFKMNFSNLKGQTYSHQNLKSNQKSLPTPTGALNSKMIDRIHKSRPGCSACGKKVM